MILHIRLSDFICLHSKAIDYFPFFEKKFNQLIENMTICTHFK